MNSIKQISTLDLCFSFQILDEREEPGFLTGLKIPAPWAAGKTVETIHPVRDNYKFKETVHIPGARCLYLRFDPRCSSQYDYDKVPISINVNVAVIDQTGLGQFMNFYIEYL